MVLIPNISSCKKLDFLIGAFRCGNKPPVELGENKKALAKENLQV